MCFGFTWWFTDDDCVENVCIEINMLKTDRVDIKNANIMRLQSYGCWCPVQMIQTNYVAFGIVSKQRWRDYLKWKKNRHNNSEFKKYSESVIISFVRLLHFFYYDFPFLFLSFAHTHTYSLVSSSSKDLCNRSAFIVSKLYKQN